MCIRDRDYTLTIRSEKKPIGTHSRTRYYFLTIDDGSGSPTPRASRDDWRQSFVSNFGLSDVYKRQPEKARTLGSDYIVVGRPITASADPVAAYRRVLNDFFTGGYVK